MQQSHVALWCNLPLSAASVFPPRPPSVATPTRRSPVALETGQALRLARTSVSFVSRGARRRADPGPAGQGAPAESRVASGDAQLMGVAHQPEDAHREQAHAPTRASCRDPPLLEGTEPHCSPRRTSPPMNSSASTSWRRNCSRDRRRRLTRPAEHLRLRRGPGGHIIYPEAPEEEARATGRPGRTQTSTGSSASPISMPCWRSGAMSSAREPTLRIRTACRPRSSPTTSPARHPPRRHRRGTVARRFQTAKIRAVPITQVECARACRPAKSSMVKDAEGERSFFRSGTTPTTRTGNSSRTSGTSPGSPTHSRAAARSPSATGSTAAACSAQSGA